MADLESDDDQTRSLTILAAGTKVSHYKIISKIGAGGMGEVYLAEDTGLHRKVALKFLQIQYAVDSDFNARFVREAEAAAKLDHPNVVTIHEVSDYHGRPFFAMHFIEGPSLRQLIKEQRLTLNSIIDLATQLCEGLQEAHEAGIVHRDIKPSNIILDKKGHPQILDFGLAAVRGTDKLTKVGSTLGTVGYMSPEQAEGKEVDQRSDLFSLGVVLYEMITGKRPFDRDTDVATSKAIVTDTAEPLVRYKSAVPNELQRIVTKLLEKDPALRYQSAAGVVSDLKPLGSSGTRSILVTTQTSRTKRLAWAAVLSVAVLAAWGGLELKDWLIPAKTPAKSLAVVDFDNIGAEEDAYLASGLAEDLAVKLRQLEGFQVASSADTRRLAKENLLPREIASRLKVQYALGGSLLREDTLVRVNVELIDRETGNVIWSEQINKKFTEIFQFMDEVSLKIVQALKVRLTPVEEAAMAAKPTDNAAAYDHYLKGRHYYYNITFRDNELAAKEFERALQLDPHYPLALAGLADAYVQRYRERFDYDEYWLDSSEVLIDRALTLDEALAEAYESRAEVLMEEDNITGALEAAQKARDLMPDWDEPYVHLGNIYKKRGERDTALAMYDKALDIRPSVDALCGRGNIFLIRGQIDSAREAYQTAMEWNPNHDRPYIDLAGLNEELFEGAESERLYRRAIEVRPDHVTGYELLSQRMYYRGSIQEGEDLLRDFVERFPYNWDAYNALYEYLAWWRGDYPAAFKVVEESLSRNPNRVWPHLLLASSYAEKISPETQSDKSIPESEKAVLAVDRALALRPNSGRVLEWAGAVYYSLNRLEEALDYFNQALELRPGSSDILTWISYLFVRMEESEKAVLFARTAVEQSPGKVDNYYYLQYALLSFSRGQEFLEIIQQAAGMYGDDPEFLKFLSEEHRLAGNYEDAVSAAQRALAIKTAGWGGFEQLALALWLSGNAEGALSSFNKEVDRYSTAYWIVALLKSEGRFDEIESYLDSIKIETPAHVSGMDHWAGVAGRYYMSMRKYDDALAVYKEFGESGEVTGPVYNTLAMAGCLRQKGVIDSSRQLLEELMQTAAGADQPYVLRDLSLLRAIGSRDLEAALKLAERASAKQNKPTSPVLEILLRLQFASGRLEEIGETIELVKEISVTPSFSYLRAQLAAVTGLEKAETFLEQAISRLNRTSRGQYSAIYLCNASAFRALALSRLGESDEAAREVMRSLNLEPERADIAYHASCTYSLLGDTALALQWLETAIDRGYLHLWWARVDPDLDPLRELPQFTRIMNDWDDRIQTMLNKQGLTN